MNPQQTEVIINHLKEKLANWVRNDTSEVPSCIEKCNALIKSEEPHSYETDVIKKIIEKSEASLMSLLMSLLNQKLKLSQTNSKTAKGGNLKIIPV